MPPRLPPRVRPRPSLLVPARIASLALAFALPLALAPLAGCAGAAPRSGAVAETPAAAEPPPPPAQPAAPAVAPMAEEEAPADADDALAQLERAEAELRGAIGPARDRPPKSPAPTTARRPAPAGEAAPLKQGADASGAAGDPCAIACRALGSMRRAADHLCGLAGEQDGRCASARGRVRGADAEVRQTCPQCAP